MTHRKDQILGYGWLGLLLIIVANLLCWMKFQPFLYYVTPLSWTGYILFVDAIIYFRKKESLIMNRAGEFAVMLVLSIVLWLVFEVYNNLLQNWSYTGLPSNTFLRLFGYGWSFATIWPAIFETSELLDELIPEKKHPQVKRTIKNSFVFWSVLLGMICLVYPVLFPSPYLFGLIWIGFILVLEPINYTSNRPSLLEEWQLGSNRRFWLLMLAGYICGFLWEFWNFRSGAKWIYTVPIGPNRYIFEMPVVGFLGFGPFAVECFVMYVAITGSSAWSRNTKDDIYSMKDRWRHPEESINNKTATTGVL